MSIRAAKMVALHGMALSLVLSPCGRALFAQEAEASPAAAETVAPTAPPIAFPPEIAALLQRWRLTPEEYARLSEAEKAALLRGIALADAGRRLQIEQLKRHLGPEGEKRLTPDGHVTAEDQDYLARIDKAAPEYFADLNPEKIGVTAKLAEWIKTTANADPAQAADRARILFDQAASPEKIAVAMDVNRTSEMPPVVKFLFSGPLDWNKGNRDKRWLTAARDIENAYGSVYESAIVRSPPSPSLSAQLADAYVRLAGDEAAPLPQKILAAAFDEALKGVTPAMAQAALNATRVAAAEFDKAAQSAKETETFGIVKSLLLPVPITNATGAFVNAVGHAVSYEGGKPREYIADAWLRPSPPGAPERSDSAAPRPESDRSF